MSLDWDLDPGPLSYQGNAKTFIPRSGYQIIEPSNGFWFKFGAYLEKSMNTHSVKCRLAYSKKYFHILNTQNAQDLLTLSNDKRIHIMKALASLSKFVGCYNVWTDIIERYKIRWTSNDGLSTFRQITEPKYSIDSMISWLNETRSQLPNSYSNILLFSTLTGLRPQESIMSIGLLKENKKEYFQADNLILEHYKFPSLFFRPTKKAYITITIRHTLDAAKKSGNHSYNALRQIIKKRGLQMLMAYCRKIYATHLHNDGIESEIIDLLQGRIPNFVFVRHYFRPDFPTQKIRESTRNLYEILNNHTDLH
jgi:hypothetical protein